MRLLLFNGKWYYQIFKKNCPHYVHIVHYVDFSKSKTNADNLINDGWWDEKVSSLQSVLCHCDLSLFFNQDFLRLLTVTVIFLVFIGWLMPQKEQWMNREVFIFTITTSPEILSRLPRHHFRQFKTRNIYIGSWCFKSFMDPTHIKCF